MPEKEKPQKGEAEPKVETDQEGQKQDPNPETPGLTEDQINQIMKSKAVQDFVAKNVAEFQKLSDKVEALGKPKGTPPSAGTPKRTEAQMMDELSNKLLSHKAQ